MKKSELTALIKASVEETIQKLRKDLETLLPADNNEYCTIKAITDKYKVTKATVHNWAKRNTIKKYKINGRTLYKLSEIEKGIN